MFEGFANVWTPVAQSRSLREKPLSVRLAGEPLVLFRDGRGGVGALLDRCPHRGVALSLGEVGADGCIQCPFHGWAFRGDGACTHIPLNDVPAEKRARHGATPVPVRETGGFLWIFTGPDAAGTEPEVPEALRDPEWHYLVQEASWSTHWTRAMENMLDMPHLPFVHRRSIGREMRRNLRLDTMMKTSVLPESWGAWIQGEVDGKPMEVKLAWRKPNGMELHIPLPRGRARLHVYCVPEDHDHTKMMLIRARDFMRSGPAAWVLDRLPNRVLTEDQAVVESSQPKEVPPAGDEISVATDAPTLHFRKYYWQALRGSSSALVPASKLARGNGRREEAAEEAETPLKPAVEVG
jgi:phenylpropionate dioxygenase-like ring-hydroxylating dioxygenase large terminal subunit